MIIRVGTREVPALALLGVLCVLVCGLGLWQAVDDSTTIDEPVYVTAGLTALQRHDLRYNPQHPPLAKAVAAIPALFAHPTLPLDAQWRSGSQRPYMLASIDALARAGKLKEVTTLTRLVPLLEIAASGLLIFLLAARLAGPPGGLFAAALWLLNPFVIGLGHLDIIDVPFTVCALAFALALVRWLERPGRGRLVVLGVACGVAMTVRDTGPILLAVGMVVAAVASRRVAPPLILALAAAAVVWVVYGALDPAYTLRHLNVLPQRYLDGFDALADVHDQAMPAFLFGHRWDGGRWWFWPGSTLIKIPASLLIAYVAAPFFLRRAPRPELRRVAIGVVPAAVLLGGFTFAAPLDLGLRYMLPVFALLTVLVAPIVLGTRSLSALLAVAAAAFTALSVPHSLSWIAPPFGPGYKIAAASNLDVGQDAGLLEHWAKGKNAWLECYSPWPLCAKRIPGAHILRAKATPAQIHGWVGVSASAINLHQWTPWLKHMRPQQVLGGTELIYHLR